MLTMTFLGLTAIFGTAALARARALRARRAPVARRVGKGPPR